MKYKDFEDKVVHKFQLMKVNYHCHCFFQFSSTDNMLKVSAKTIKRRISQYGLEEEAHYTSLSDSGIDVITAEFVHTHPSGHMMVFVPMPASISNSFCDAVEGTRSSCGLLKQTVLKEQACTRPFFLFFF